MECKGRNTSVVNLISSSHQDADQTWKKGTNKYAEWNYLLPRVEKDDDDLILLQKITNLESTFDGIKQYIHDLKETVLNRLMNKCGAYGNPEGSKPLPFKPSSTPRKSEMTDINIAQRIQKTLSERGELGDKKRIPKEGDKDHEPSTKVRVRKLFSPSTKKKTSDKFLLVKSTPTGNYIVSKTNKDTPLKRLKQSIPSWLSLMFKSIETMDLSYEECAVASYIFSFHADEKSDKEDVMITTAIKYCVGTRKLLQCLKPREMLDQDIIDLAVSMLTYAEKSNTINPIFWFLPTTFSQFAISWTKTTKDMIKNYQHMFMGKFDLISKIFIPMHDYDFMHWFLLVIDFVKEELIYLDPLPSPLAQSQRMRSIKKLAFYMDDLLMDPSFYPTATTNKSIISDFKLVIPDGLGVQAGNSNDCGIWVITWMMQMGADGYKINVDDGTRLRIALDLIMKPYNELNNVVLTRALQRFEIEGFNKA